MRIIHLSDIHVWHWPRRPGQLLSKRLVGVAALLAGRAARFPRGRLGAVLDRVASLRPDHLLITGDVTTTALPSEFTAIRSALAPLIDTLAGQVTIVPGNHDRYTRASVRGRLFEKAFTELLPQPEFPWIKPIDASTVVLGLDPCRAHVSATGYLPAEQFEAARALVSRGREAGKRIVVACHYPLATPPGISGNLKRKRLVNAGSVSDWLRGIGPHLYCCGHVHTMWAFHPTDVPEQLCLNPGPPLMISREASSTQGFFEIELEADAVRVDHHGWSAEAGWQVRRMAEEPAFFAGAR